MDLFLQLVANGLVLGAFYALSALGLTLVFGLMRVVNFAHGELYVIGGLFGWALTAVFGWNYFLALVVVVIVLGILGYLIDQILIARVRGQGEEPTILLTIGLSIFIANTALLIVGTTPVTVASPFASKPLILGPVVITQARLLLVVICAVLIAAANLLIQKTTLGRAMRATFQDPMAAQLVGIRTPRIYGFTFALGATLAGAAGMLLGSIYVVEASTGGIISLKAFVVVILGGMGSFAGAVAGGLILGLTEALWGGYVSTGYVDAIGFALVIVTLLVRPYGLFSRRAERA
ncbi:branched-chain amino acid ABC transporter permease [Bradyrhizobium sp. NAS80.1]|uniref:branched-chain amino acid ABC transporter permease n=1 Tax=Bradyrhizobium sp. NAS80.1 TaxID=1680159 RepID=UPI00096758E9|nr:branched-chain amino acid ABC transporter permease [Bradyrhizobium sp. NAS80.1]OKO87020.1 branched-chain amino acid ABC transporter permease [Bradyrhizobium sp. NAS80.1]